MAHELFDDMQPFAEMLDAAYGGERYSATMRTLRQRIDQPDSTPSAQVLEGVRKEGGFLNFTLQLSAQHQRELLAQGLDAQGNEKFLASVQSSWQAQSELEAQDQGSFEDYVARYYA